MCDLDTNIPQQVIDTLRYITRKEDYPFDDPPSHPFFEPETDVVVNQYWRYIFQFPRYGSDLDKFPDTGISVFQRAFQGTEFEADWYKLTLRCEVNIEPELILLFLSWLAPYMDITHGNFLGYYRQTNNDDNPTLLYVDEDKIFASKILNPVIRQVT